MIIISAWIGAGTGKGRTRAQYWTGQEWSARLADAARYFSVPVAKRVAELLADRWHAIIGVDEVIDPATAAPKSRELALARRQRKKERRETSRPGERRANPVPLSRRASLNASRERFANFRGDPPGGITPVTVKVPHSAMTVGELDGVLYTTERDGKTERYQHKFRKKSRPLLAASDDGKTLHIVGGQYEFTERGIVDT